MVSAGGSQALTASIQRHRKRSTVAYHWCSRSWIGAWGRTRQSTFLSDRSEAIAQRAERYRLAAISCCTQNGEDRRFLKRPRLDLLASVTNPSKPNSPHHRRKSWSGIWKADTLNGSANVVAIPPTASRRAPFFIRWKSHLTSNDEPIAFGVLYVTHSSLGVWKSPALIAANCNYLWPKVDNLGRRYWKDRSSLLPQRRKPVLNMR